VSAEWWEWACAADCESEARSLRAQGRNEEAEEYDRKATQHKAAALQLAREAYR
jgi:hypothetical protein